jgi:AmmeMemoRadiSam system protein B
MRIREYSLPQGWYPREKKEISRFLSGYNCINSSRAVIAPHAGWYYSGKIAARSVSSLDSDARTVVVLGGHLPAGYPALFAFEDAVRTPIDTMRIDTELRSFLIKALDGQEDLYRDNTIEVLLPMISFFFPDMMLLWLRLPAELSSYDAGKAIGEYADKLSRKINVAASTDLTHYGSNYGFSPKGRGDEALKWVKEVNDLNFINAVQSGNEKEVLKCAEQDQSSCSAGAVLGAMGFASYAGLGQAKLLEYGNSADADGGSVPDSFVGYAAMAFDK